jgi:hypothetical protein
LQHSQRRTVISPSNCGIDLPYRLKTHSTYCEGRGSTRQKLAYEILNGPYDWNRDPLAPLGCKAIVYEDGNTRESWASRGMDAFYLGPAKDHYRCDNYYVPETRAYRISGSTELFPQHCQLPSLTPHQLFQALTDKLTEHTAQASNTSKGRRLLRLLALRVKNILNPPLWRTNKGWKRTVEPRNVRQNKG